ncbi:MAG: CusA/CzcA family heavy metal efflux RND transporter [Bacteroidia bacterium]
MIDRIIRFSIHHKIVVGLFVAALLGWGTYSLTQLPIDALPDITNNQVQIITVAPTLASQEVEQYVTAPIESACANLPDMVELRSISKLGLSVITVVFKDEVEIYKARQMVNERIVQARENIPKGVGNSELAPVATGLGEIYQYVLHTKKGYENSYTSMDLRTIQDWNVRRQLLGVPGVADINTLGGYLKQYEIAINPDKLRSMNIAISELFEALESNNENTGGSYIEKGTNSYFIRGLGMVSSIKDIESIVVKTIDGLPILVRDISTVQFGSATRYGAATRDGKGEVVVGVVMMLKGQNAADVTERVKEKITTIQKSLPAGVVIEPFLDRSSLVERAIKTVKTNLIEGGLIVIFILVLLLGNWRAGLVVASVIPLSMLFALGMMRVFGVSGNLMSLGAIDFGIIVDGAVIIVEAIVHRIRTSKISSNGVLTQAQMNEEVYQASSKIRTSAAFGEIIILIVYLPILTLTGIEGKMFVPMAQVVSFAILGAFLLSLTYVPMMSALCLSKKTENKRNVSDNIIDFFQRLYNPLIHFSIKRKGLVIITAFVLFIGSLFVFINMGSEFIPTLEEGDLAINTRVMPGSSLTQNIEMVTRVEQLLKKEFPEIKQIVSRIGSSEIPTDPMSVEVADIIVVLKDKSEWTTAKSREELAEEITVILKGLPGISLEISQPIQLRFNELMTGVRSDIAIKIYGDDLDLLALKANEAVRIIENTSGVADLRAEQTTGLPQITVQYNREKMAQYGLHISDINTVLRTAFAGEVAGVVFEGEKRFDMVVRFQKDFRTDISNIRSLFIPLPGGGQIPISQLADINFKEGPMQISRDDARRRVTLGLNVRNRDVKSVVDEISAKLDKELNLPAGYYITYGGQFQNLVEANKRLAIAVPVALLLILVLLFFTFNSLRQTLLIFTAIPLSAIGGVLALWVRGMPFSISAGVGFIALFGVAVLNGIVLIAYFNQLKKEGMTDINQRVLEGTKLRLRPVIMTAAVASLGFLPMALSNSAGAEVQRPLATVVIGGLITATLLTLVVLPALYIFFSGENKKGLKKTGTIIATLILGFMMLPQKANSQTSKQKLTLDAAINESLKNNGGIKSNAYVIELQKQLKSSAVNIDKTRFLLTQDPTSGGNIDNSLSVTQDISFPTVYRNQQKLATATIKNSEEEYNIAKNELIAEVKSAFYQLYFAQEKVRLLKIQDSLYTNFLTSAELRYKTGETNLLEKVTAETELMQLKNLLSQAQTDMLIQQKKLQTLLNTDSELVIDGNEKLKRNLILPKDSSDISQNPYLGFLKQQIEISNYSTEVEKSKLMPDFTLGYFHQTVIGGYNPNDISRNYYGKSNQAGFQFGVAVPLWFGAQQGKIKASKISTQIAENNYQYYQSAIQSDLYILVQELDKYSKSVTYYETTANSQAELILKHTEIGFKAGEIGYMEYIQSLNRISTIKNGYLEALNQYNQVVISIEKLIGTK